MEFTEGLCQSIFHWHMYSGSAQGLELDQVNLTLAVLPILAGSGPQADRLIEWTKLDGSVLAHPPAGLPDMTGFRDPFVFARKSEGSPWKMIVGSGTKSKGGTILLYHSQSLTTGVPL